MRRSRFEGLLLALVLALVGAGALAQEGMGADLSARIAELQARAQRLSVLAELPAEARGEAEALLGRYEELRRAEQELEVARLEALVAALEAGESQGVASQMAESAVAERRVELTRQREELIDAVEALAEQYPEASGLVRRLLAQRVVTGTFAFGAPAEITAVPALPGNVLRFSFDGADGFSFERAVPQPGRIVLPGLRQGR